MSGGAGRSCSQELPMTSTQRKKIMLISRFVSKTALTTFTVAALTYVQPSYAQTASDSDRIEKLERAGEQLQKRNADLESEVKTLKKQNAFASPAEGPTKKQTTYDGKTYVEKEVPV